jgi:tight adherence protein B
MSSDAIRLLLLILIFGAVMLAVEGLVGWIRSSQGLGRAINRRLKMIEAGYDRAEIVSRLRRDDDRDLGLPEPIAGIWRGLGRMIHGAGLAISPGLLLLLMLGGFVVLAIGIAAFAYLGGYGLTAGRLVMIVSFAAAAGLGIPLLIVSRLSDMRRKKMEAQFPVALDVFVRGLRAGHPIASALDLLTKEMTDPIGSEFGVVVDEVTYGADLRDALQAMADRWKMSDLQMFVVSLSVQTETGGNLAEILENLSGVIRERASMFMKVRALSSEGRMTAVILTALPVLSFVGLFVLNASFYLDVADDPVFLPGFISLIVLYFVGFYAIRRMIDLEV